MWRPKQRHIDEGEVHSLLYKHSWMDDSLVDYDDTKVTFFSAGHFNALHKHLCNPLAPPLQPLLDLALHSTLKRTEQRAPPPPSGA